MRLGLLSDTHVDNLNYQLPPQIKEEFHGADLILHAGDIFLTSVLRISTSTDPFTIFERAPDAFNAACLFISESSFMVHLLRCPSRAYRSWVDHFFSVGCSASVQHGVSSG